MEGDWSQEAHAYSQGEQTQQTNTKTPDNLGEAGLEIQLRTSCILSLAVVICHNNKNLKKLYILISSK